MADFWFWARPVRGSLTQTKRMYNPAIRSTAGAVAGVKSATADVLRALSNRVQALRSLFAEASFNAIRISLT